MWRCRGWWPLRPLHAPNTCGTAACAMAHVARRCLPLTWAGHGVLAPWMALVASKHNGASRHTDPPLVTHKLDRGGKKGGGGVRLGPQGCLDQGASEGAALVAMLVCACSVQAPGLLTQKTAAAYKLPHSAPTARAALTCSHRGCSQLVGCSHPLSPALTRAALTWWGTNDRTHGIGRPRLIMRASYTRTAGAHACMHVRCRAGMGSGMQRGGAAAMQRSSCKPEQSCVHHKGWPPIVSGPPL